MKKCTDKDVLVRSGEFEKKHRKKLATLKDFRKKFNEYQRAKGGDNTTPNLACQPYIEVFRQPKEKRKS